MADESKNLVEVLTEIIQENDANDSGLPNNLNGNLSQPFTGIDSSISDETEDDLGDDGSIIESKTDK